MMDLFPLSPVGWGLNASSWNGTRRKGSVVSVAPLRSFLISVQLKWTKSAPKHSSQQQCCLNWQQPERDLPIAPERLLWKGPRTVQTEEQRSASPHISAACPVGNIFRGRMLETNLSPKPSWQAEIADACTLIVECDRALSGRSCRRESALLSSSPNQLLSPRITFESSTIYLVSRTALRMCVLQSLHDSIRKS